MFFNMRFSADKIKYLFVEVNRVLKKEGINLFSVRSDHDPMYRKGISVEKDIYEINGFQIRFFTKSDIEDIVTNQQDSNLLKMSDAKCNTPVNLYLSL